MKKTLLLACAALLIVFLLPVLFPMPGLSGAAAKDAGQAASAGAAQDPRSAASAAPFGSLASQLRTLAGAAAGAGAGGEAGDGADVSAAEDPAGTLRAGTAAQEPGGAEGDAGQAQSASSALVPVPAAPLPETLRLLADGQVLELGLEDYLFGVVAAEMPASFPEEALKAQAVAARTYALYCAASRKHPEADLCADPGCCQAWQGEEALRARWGEDFETCAARIRGAVAATAGESLRYGGEPVFAAFHSSSAGATEDCGALWEPRPYLVSVSSPETAADVPGYVSVLRCAPLDFRDTLLSLHPEADMSGAEADWVEALLRDESGRVSSVRIGGQEFSGTALRQLFSLRSTAFDLEYRDGWFVFTVTGHGHGVGMSQYGAKVLAENGAGYREILAHYYPGTELDA